MGVIQIISIIFYVINIVCIGIAAGFCLNSCGFAEQLEKSRTKRKGNHIEQYVRKGKKK